MFYDSADSKKAKFSAAYLKQRQTNPKVTKAPEQISWPQNLETDSFVQVASTAGPSVRVLTPQHTLDDHVIPSPSIPANVVNSQAPSAGQEDNWPHEDNQEGEEDADVKRHAEASLVYRKRWEAESNKENVPEIADSQHTKTAKKRTFWERDPRADQISPINSENPDFSDHDNEISSDSDFQTQVESSNAAKQRRSKPAIKRPSSRPKRRLPKKVRVQEHVDDRSLDERAEVASDEQEAEVPLSQRYREYVRVNQSAKQKMAVVTKPPQSRTAWTGAETDMLYHLITEYGTSWKLLKAEDLAQGHVLEGRDQVALKDKARNMKMDFLKYVTSSFIFSAG